MTPIDKIIELEIKQKRMKDLSTFLNENCRSEITIRWSEPIGTDKIEKDLLSSQARKLLNMKDVVYLIDGKNSKGETVYYIGKADKETAADRLYGHQNIEADYIEGMLRPYDNIRIGEISGITRTPNVIEQIESHLIFTMAHSKDKSNFCNDKKIQSYTKHMDLPVITNTGKFDPLPKNVMDPVEAGIGEVKKENNEIKVYGITAEKFLNFNLDDLKSINS